MVEDNSKANGTETASVTIVPNEDAVTTRPGIEEGPHLQDPDIRAAKRKQLIDAGFDHEDERLTPDMAAILKEKG